MISFNVYNGGVKLYFGINSVEKVGKHLEDFKNLLIVTGKGSARLSGALSDIEKILQNMGIEYEICDKASPNPTDDIVEEVVSVYRDGEYDGFIAIGGGSVIDLVKAVRAVVSGGGVIGEYLHGLRKPPINQPFLLAINLTHGTGSEIDRFSVITITSTMEKLGFSPGYPTVSIDDPRYTTTLPRDQTIYTTLDAFSHAIESATSDYSSPYTTLLAVEAVDKIINYLPKTIAELHNVEYRYWLLYASMIAGISKDHGYTHLGHLIEHVLTGYNPKLPHGAGLGILYRELIGIFYKAFPEKMAILLKPLKRDLKPVEEHYVEAQRAYNRLLDEIGFTELLGDFGFDRKDIDRMESLYNKFINERYGTCEALKLSFSVVREVLYRLL